MERIRNTLVRTTSETFACSLTAYEITSKFDHSWIICWAQGQVNPIDVWIPVREIQAVFDYEGG